MNRRRMNPVSSDVGVTTVGGMIFRILFCHLLRMSPIIRGGVSQVSLRLPWPRDLTVTCLEPTLSRLNSTALLSILSLSLHSALVAIHVALLVVWSRGLENLVVFAVGNEPFVSRGIKVVSTTFGTIYSALLVFVTQKLVLRRNFCRSQTLTATHDSVRAWTGLGSALVCVWQQKAITASISGVLSAFVYLANILVLHVTFPGLLAVDSVFLNSSVSVTTQGLPVLNLSGYDLSNQSDRLNLLNTAQQYGQSSLGSFPFLSMEDTEGLYGGTLYDAWSNNTAAIGLASVNATGFNVSCGYLSITPVASGSDCPCVYLGGIKYSLAATTPNVIAPLLQFPDFEFGVAPRIFYSSIPILDSNNQTGPWVNPFSGGFDDFFNTSFANPQGLFNIWETWYSAMPLAVPPPELSEVTNTPIYVVDLALLQGLNLFPFNTSLKSTIYLHELENELANIVASIFWTLGHVPPSPGYDPSNLTTTSPALNVSLLAGNAMVEETILQGRLNIIGGLLASIVLMSLSLHFVSFPKATSSDVQPEGANMLHSIWLYRNHHELRARLTHVMYPTDFNLREAGMLCTRLIASSVDAIGSDDFDMRPAISSYQLRHVLEGTNCLPARKGSAQNSRDLSLVSAVLHSLLVAIHLALLIFLAVLLFVTQTLAFRRNLRKLQMITVTHDNIAAWDGIGSALVHIWHQKAVPVSVFGVLSVLVYLAGILVLHITSPALLSVQPFGFNYSAPVTTQSLPNFAFSGYNPTSWNARTDMFPLLYAQGSLSFLPFLNSTTRLGLHGAILYDVLELNSGAGNVTVDATRFDMTCGYIADAVVDVDVKILGAWYYSLYEYAGMISTLTAVPPTSVIENLTDAELFNFFDGSAIFYSTIPILDSNGDGSPLVNFTGVFDEHTSQGVQIFTCSAKPVKSMVLVDSQSREVIYIDQETNTDPSIWTPVNSKSDNSTDSDLGPEQTLADNWEWSYLAMPHTIAPSWAADMVLDVAETFFVEQLDLPVNSTGRTNITLREFENTLSELVASIYWTRFTPTSLTPNGPPPLEVSLLQGTAEVIQTNIEARLDIAGGLIASAILLLLSLPFLDFHKSREQDDDVAIGGMGILHAIWLYREHPELEKLLVQVVEPTDVNLRKAGMDFSVEGLSDGMEGIFTVPSPDKLSGGRARLPGFFHTFVEL
ncbi:hypothetical protein K438DRAFT_1768163 [Mycena galopus ATCC 62051]|nr:hypothetical protein K438DRAFT_1768163 [Mycena galopus ATCC 62051]